MERKYEYHDPVPRDELPGLKLHTRLYTYREESVLVAGWTMSVTFVIPAPVKLVWQGFSDFNPWQNAYGHFYSGVIGDLQGQGFRIGTRPNDPTSYSQFEYHVSRVIPEQLIVISQPVPSDGRNGGVSPGFHVFMLSEQGGETTITGLMDHATGALNVSEEEALAPWRRFAPEAQRKWREVFIPSLARLVLEKQPARVAAM